MNERTNERAKLRQDDADGARRCRITWNLYQVEDCWIIEGVRADTPRTTGWRDRVGSDQESRWSVVITVVAVERATARLTERK